MVVLNLNFPADARKFLMESLPEAIPGITNVTLESGRKIDIKDMTDEEVVRYAWDLLPIYKAAFPEMVHVDREH